MVILCCTLFHSKSGHKIATEKDCLDKLVLKHYDHKRHRKFRRVAIPVDQKQENRNKVC